MKKRLCSLFLAVVMCLSLVPAVAFGKTVSTLQYTEVNPIYADVLSESDLLCKPQRYMAAPGEETTYLTETAEIAAAIRAGLVQRQESIVVNVQTDSALTEDDVRAYFAAAFAETDSAVAGDYLSFQFRGYGLKASGITDGTRHWYTLTYTVFYYTTKAQEDALTQQVNAVLNDLHISSMTNDYDKVSAIYSYITSNITYDYTHDADYKLKYTAYAALMNKTAVCQGYAVLLYRMLRQSGIGCRVVTGLSGGNHAWNIAEIDGIYYALDVTWDAGETNWSYFLRAHANMANHELDEGYTQPPFTTLYPVSTTDYTLAAGSCGASLTWTLDNAGTLTVSGTGAMDNYKPCAAPWCDHDNYSKITSVVIGNGVTSVGDYALCSCVYLTDVVIPSGVTSIGNGAFSSCAYLTDVVIPSGVTSVGDHAFSSCVNLTDVVIPSGVTSIGDGAFSGCVSLTGVTIPDSVTSIGRFAFIGCRSLTDITIPSGVTDIGQHTFSGCSSLTDITIPSGVTSIGYHAFSFCSSLTGVTIPVSVTSIGAYAFVGCTSLTDVYYNGTEAQWNAISIENNNDSLTGATMHFAEPHTHAYTAVVTAPTCTEQGYTTYTCSVCGDSYEDNYTDATGHTPAAAVKENVVDATCTTSGSYDSVVYCSECGEELSRTHETVAALGHKLTKTAAKAATCTTAGNSAYYTCSTCHKYFKDSTGKTEIAKNSWVVKAKGHSYKATVVKPTYDAQGYTLHKCSVCGKSYKDTYTAKLTLKAPTVKISTNATSGKPTLTWAKVTGASKYYVYRATSKSGTYYKMATVTGTSYTNTSAKPGTTYYYKVKAVTAADTTSAFSAIKSITCDCAAPVVSITTSSGKPKLTWKKVDGATSYVVYRATSKSGTYTKLTSTTGTAVTNKSAKKGTTYYYKVKALCSKSSNATSAFSSVKSIKATK